MKAPYKPNKINIFEEEASPTWSGVIGGLLINFAAVEYASFRWVDALSDGNDIMRDLSIDINFSRRIALIHRLIDRAEWPEPRKVEAKMMWTKAGKLSEIRNTIAHNPLCSLPDETDGLKMGVINTKKMKGVGPYSIEVVSLNEIQSSGHSLAELSAKLHGFLREPHDNEGEPV
jgi:hypothetical protein